MGPTASGKTGVAVDLVLELPCEIVSVDSAQVYRHMDVGTAKPDAATLKIAPHQLIDLIEPDDSYSAARFRDDALTAMREITERGNPKGFSFHRVTLENALALICASCVVVLNQATPSSQAI
jgi:tRNA dimethylallyltransferase